MKNITTQQSIFFFIFGCIITRLIFAMLPLLAPESWTPILGLIAIGISIGFFYRFFTNTRLHAFESGGDTWWSKLRLIHGCLWLAASVYIWCNNNKLATFSLLVDTIIGIIFFLQHRFLVFHIHE